MIFKTKTTRVGKAPFAWSYSRLKNYEACPYKHQQVDLLKTYKEEENDQLLYGNRIHKAAAERLGPEKKPLPKEYRKVLGKYCDGLEKTPGEIHVELSAALTEDLQPCGYFDPDVWLRMKIDVVKLNSPVALVLDWKTGKIIDDSVQLALSAAWVFAQYPDIKRVRSEFIWLKFKARTHATLKRSDMPTLWASLEDRIGAMKQSADSGIYPKKKSGLCGRYCPVTDCEHNGQ